MDIFIEYVAYQCTTRQGKANEIYDRYQKVWDIKPWGKGNGNWLLTKPSDVLLNGKSCRSFVLNHYEREKLTEQLVNRFREDITNGAISLDDIYYD